MNTQNYISDAHAMPILFYFFVYGEQSGGDGCIFVTLPGHIL